MTALQKNSRVVMVLRHYGLLSLAVLAILGLSALWVWPLRGLVGRYYDNPNWQGEPVFISRDSVLTVDDLTQKHAAFPQRNFSVDWTGWIHIEREGEYGFATESDDGSSLFIDGQKVVENGGAHAARKISGKLFLSRGLHMFQTLYFQGAAAYKLKVFWQPPGEPETGIPPHVLYPKPFPIRGIGFLIRNLRIFYPLAWIALILILVGTRLVHERGNVTKVAREYAQNLAVTLVTILIFAIAAEGVMRLAFAIQDRRKDVKALLKESQETDLSGESRTYSLKGIVQESSYENIVYELKPNLQGIFRSVPLFTNSRGLRDVEYSYRKPEDTFRIVGLGDSSLFGWGVRAEDTSLKVLERLLNQSSSSTTYDVMNFAVPGYNTAIEVEVFLEKCLKYDPDMVIMHFNTNDYDVPGFMKPPQSYATLKKSYLLNFLMERVEALLGRQQQEMLPFVFERTLALEESERLDEDPAFPEEYRHMVGKRGFLRAMDTLVDATASRGIPLVVYVVKAYPGIDPEYTPDPFRDRQLELITQVSREKSFHLVNMYAVYMEYLQQHLDADQRVFWVTEQDSHPSAVAHRIEAETLYDFLVSNGLI